MTHEKPTPFPIPEITIHPEVPPALMTCEIDPQELTDLMSLMSQGREPTLRHVAIRGGLIPNNEFGQLLDEKTLDYIVGSPDPNQELFDLIYKGNWSAGSYYALENALTVHADTIFLLSLAHLAAVDTVSPLQNKIDALNSRIHYLSGSTLVDEVAHSFQEERYVGIVFDDVRKELEEQAKQSSSEPMLILAGMRAVSFNILIPDERVLELYDIARDRYRLLYSRNDSGIQEKLL